MLKILQINKFYHLKGGSERYFFDLSDLLKRRGHKIIPFAMADTINEYSSYSEYFADKVEFNFNFKNIFKIFYNYDAVKRLRKLIKVEKPDIAHLHNIAHQLSPAIIGVLKENNIPIIQTLHDYKLICPAYRLFNKGNVCYKCKHGYYNCLLEKCSKDSRLRSLLLTMESYFNEILKTYDKIDLFIAPSDFMKKTCVEFGVREDKIRVLNYFLTSDFLMQAPNDCGAGEYLLYFGRLSEEKGIDVLLNAIARLDFKTRVKIVGKGPEQKNLKSMLKAQGLNDKVELMGARYDHELRELIINAKAIIIPSIWPENMPYSLSETLAMGKVAIASRIGGMQEFIKDGENGFLFKPGSERELAEKIKALDRYNLKEIGRKAHQRVAKLNEENHYIEIMKIYQEVLKR